MINWNGYQVAAPDDVPRLDADYGHRVSMGIPGQMAAQGTYSDYRRGLHNEAAAHHLVHGQRASQTGEKETAGRHQALYGAHVRAAGHRRGAAVPPEVQAHLHAVADPGHRFFVAHRGDQMLGS